MLKCPSTTWTAIVGNVNSEHWNRKQRKQEQKESELAGQRTDNREMEGKPQQWEKVPLYQVTYGHIQGEGPKTACKDFLPPGSKLCCYITYWKRSLLL